MAFNFGAFAAGASEAVTTRIRVNEDRMQKRLEESRREARAVRLRKQAERESEKKATEEAIGALTFMGYNPATAQYIAGQGKTAVAMATDAGQRAMKRGLDVNTMINLPDVNTAKDVNETIESSTPTQDVIFGGFDRESYQTLYEDPDKISNSFGARLAVLSQKQLQTNDPDKIAGYERQKTKILKDLRAMKEAESIKDGEKGPSFSLGTIQSNVNSAFKMQLSLFDLGMDMEGKIIGKVEGKEAQAEVARLRAAQYLEGTYGSLEDAVMTDSITTLRSQAQANLKSYIDSAQTVTDLNSQEDLRTGKFNIGEVVSIPNLGKFVYTQIVNPATGLPFY
jgi:hypothetical protein